MYAEQASPFAEAMEDEHTNGVCVFLAGMERSLEF